MIGAAYNFRPPEDGQARIDSDAHNWRGRDLGPQETRTEPAEGQGNTQLEQGREKKEGKLTRRWEERGKRKAGRGKPAKGVHTRSEETITTTQWGEPTGRAAR
jgi:hypothetical protein